jgi:hypothetical protein
MADIAYLILAIAFFAICVVYVRGLDRIVRASEDIEQMAEEKGR